MLLQTHYFTHAKQAIELNVSISAEEYLRSRRLPRLASVSNAA